MPKVKKEKKETKTKEERQYDVLVKGVYEIFDRTPNGSVMSPEAHALIEKINKA